MLMRPTVVPQALNGQPFQTADALALGVSWKTLQGSRFRRLAKGVRDVRVIRLKELTAHRDGVASPEQCWLVAASTLNLLDLVTAGDSLLRLRRTTLMRLQSAVRTHSGRGHRRRPDCSEADTGTGGLAARGPGFGSAWFSPGYLYRNAT